VNVLRHCKKVIQRSPDECFKSSHCSLNTKSRIYLRIASDPNWSPLP
jgi:hypothetical protein